MKKSTWYFLFISVILGCQQQFIKYGFVEPDREDILSLKRTTWNRFDPEDGKLEVYFEGGYSYNREEIAEDIEDAYEDVLKAAMISEYDTTIVVFIIPSRLMIKRITGIESDGKVFVKSQMVLLVLNDEIKHDFTHELAQVMTSRLWGGTSRWLYEGFAVQVSENWHGYDLHALSNYILQHKEDLNIHKLINNFSNMNESISFPLAGSFVKFIQDKYGFNVLMSLWKADQLLTKSKIEQWEKEWKEDIKLHSTDGIQYEVTL